jgi:predicted GIY-YIG superfamily endonuclease
MAKTEEEIGHEIERHAPIPITGLGVPIDYHGEPPELKLDRYHVYALGLEDNCYYVGLAVRPLKRVATHLAGRGPKWTRVHPPLCVTALYEVVKPGFREATSVEEWLTYAYASAFGADRVRGAEKVNKAFEKAPECPRTKRQRNLWRQALRPSPELPSYIVDIELDLLTLMVWILGQRKPSRRRSRAA